MFILGDYIYAGEPINGLKVENARILDAYYMLVTFNTGERRVFDATQILDYPVFKPLQDVAVFNNYTIDHGVITWDNGNIDIAPEGLYEHSYELPEQLFAS
ncbi:MAG: DUF2442 domain-containing protein [Coriobacteriales bacterium]|nr:DUF2442 domain-containing protein [Coriobacteriales bacterium]